MKKWKFVVLFLTFIGMIPLSGYVQVALAGEDFTKDEIVAITPRLTLDDDGISSYGMRVKVKASEDISLDFMTFEERPGKSGLILFDPMDGTPMLVAVGDKVLYYDPLQGEVVVRRGSYSLQLAYGQNTDGEYGLKFSLAISNKKRDEREPYQNLIDVRSLINGSTCSDITISDAGVGSYVAACMSELGNLSEIRFDRRGEYNHFVQYSIRSQDENEGDSIKMLMRLSNLNTPIAKKWFKMPDKALADAGVPVVDKSEEDEKTISVDAVVLSIMLRMMPSMPDDSPEQKELESYLNLPEDFDWRRLQKNDRAVSLALRRVYADGKLLDSLSSP